MTEPNPGPITPPPVTVPPDVTASGFTRMLRPMQIIVVSSVMFTFIGYWRTAAVVLCDLASTAYYIGGIVESSVGPAAPWFILAVMIFSYAVRSVYIESCSLFVRGGVYRVVKEALGGFLGKLSVSALMFDYVLTGPTSGVSAGNYLMGLFFRILETSWPQGYDSLGLNNELMLKALTKWGSVVLATLVTLYFFRQNLRGIHESSDKALKIMIATTIMAVIMIGWCLVTLAVQGPANSVPWRPDLKKKVELETHPIDDPRREEKETWIKNPRDGKLLPKMEHGWSEVKDNGIVVDYVKNDPNDQEIPQESEALGKLYIKAQQDPLGFLDRMLPKSVLDNLRSPGGWLRLLGIVGLLIAFGHSILAMSGEETLAQVYREVESPKMKNFQKAAFIVFVYSLVLTAGISFLAVLLIPDDVRMKVYSDNLISGLTRYVLGPKLVRLFLEAFVVIIGFLILAGAVNTAIIGSNGVLNRVAEDGVLPDWFLKPHPRYGTTYRMLWLILILQVSVILFSGGDMVVLGEAYAFGVVWSFVFKALAMVVLRFKDHSPRAYRVPFNLKIGTIEIPFGLLAIFLVLLAAALLNFFTKEVATVGGLGFTAIFLSIFMISEHYHEKKLKGTKHKHLEQFNRAAAPEITPRSLGLARPFRKLVSIRSVHNLFMLEKALAETDPLTTDLVVMTAKVLPVGEHEEGIGLDSYDQQLMTAVVTRAESAGKQVYPLIVPTNNPLHAVLNTAKDLQVNELVLGASNKNTADEQLEQVAFYWISLHGGTPTPLTVRILGRDREVNLDLGGGNRIPKMSERQARSVAELRAAGVGIDRVLLAHDGSRTGSDLFQAVLTMLDPQVSLALLPIAPPGEKVNFAALTTDQQKADQLDRPVPLIEMKVGDAKEVVTRARELQFDLIILPLPPESPVDPLGQLDERSRTIVRNAHCRVLLVSVPAIPQEVVDQTPSG